MEVDSIKALIDYFLLVANKIVNILDSISFNGSASLLYYLLGAIIIGFIIKLVKGSANEFDNSFNFATGSIVKSVASKYAKKNDERKKQIIKEKRKNIVYEYMDDNF